MSIKYKHENCVCVGGGGGMTQLVNVPHHSSDSEQQLGPVMLPICRGNMKGQTAENIFFLTTVLHIHKMKAHWCIIFFDIEKHKSDQDTVRNFANYGSGSYLNLQGKQNCMFFIKSSETFRLIFKMSCIFSRKRCGDLDLNPANDFGLFRNHLIGKQVTKRV